MKSEISFDGINIDAETVRAKLAEYDAGIETEKTTVYDGKGPAPAWSSHYAMFAARGARFAMWSNLNYGVTVCANGPAGNAAEYVQPTGNRPVGPNGGWYTLEEMRELREAVEAAIVFLEK